MERGAENKPDGMGSENFQGFRMVGLKHCKGMGDNMARRPLRDLNNRTGNSVPYPSALLKRGSAEVAPCDVKNAKSINNHRPITRGFAASQAQKYHECLQNDNSRCEDQRRNQPVQATTFVNPLDEEPVAFPNDEPLPMVEEIEEMIDCELKEVEMEDLEAEILREIDISDAHNPLAVVNYVDEIYSFYRETEVLSCVPPNYMAAQSDINERMRAILIDWLIEVHYKFDLVEETLFLTVNIIDRFLARHSVLRKKLQLVGVTAMLLACKYEEVMVPVVEDLILISDRAYTREEVLQMESLIVNTLQFNMSVPTPYMFLRRFLKASQSDKQLELLTSYITELCLVEYEMLKFRPSMLAAAAVYTAQCTLKGFKHWTRTSELCSKYSDDQLLECSKMMVEIHERSGKGKLIGAYKKYSTFRFGFAARSEPALFLLDMKI